MPCDHHQQIVIESELCSSTLLSYTRCRCACVKDELSSLMSQVLSQSPANRDDCKGEAAKLGNSDLCRAQCLCRDDSHTSWRSWGSNHQPSSWLTACSARLSLHTEKRSRGLHWCFSDSSRLPHPVWPNAGAFWFWFNQLPVETRELCLSSARSFSELTQPQWEHCVKASDLSRIQKHTIQSRAG